MKTLARFKWPLLLGMIGIACMAVAISLTLDMFRTSGASFIGPGTTSVTIATPGDYTLWHETKTFVDGKFVSFPDDLPSGTTIRIFKGSDSTPVAMKKAGSSTMEINETRRVSVGDLTFDRPGVYKISVTGLPEKHSFYLDDAKFLQMFFVVFAYGFAGVLFLLTSVCLGIYFSVQASKRRA